MSQNVAKSMADFSGQQFGYFQLSAWPGKMVPFEDHLSTSGHTASLRNNPW